MGLKDLDIKDSYRSDTCSDIGRYFVSKLLEQSTTYKRAVGFFSSSALIQISRGISHLIQKPDARILLVVSPRLSKEDVEAIEQGYKNRQAVIENALIRELTPPTDEFESERLNFMCHLIEEGILDIKVANKLDIFTAEDGMYHEKMGVFEDENGNKVAFSGSLNESDNAFSHNFESILVFKSWLEPYRVTMIEDAFNRLWENKTNTLEVLEFPEAARKKLFQYQKPQWRKNIDEYEFIQSQIKEYMKDERPKYNCPFELHDYQKKAINAWAHQNYRGLFDMGTGTGKTITAMTASVLLLERLKYKLAVIIVCPYTHLVEQWIEEEEHFNVRFIVGYSSGKYKNYRSELAKAVQDFNDGIRPYFYFVTTNASYRLPQVQEILSQLKGNVLFIADEVHNFGAQGLYSSLNEKYKFRIGLSATIDRHNDPDGTAAIYSYFGEPVIHYGLKEAIENNVLTRYYYYPIVLTLTEEEREQYLEFTDQIRKNSYLDSNGKYVLNKSAEMAAIKRARVIAVAENKLEALRKTIQPHIKDHFILVYCGTGRLVDKESGDYERQLDQVCKMLGNELNMKVARYTSLEDAETRKLISSRYKTGDDLQAVVAIKCLDEGVNIPSIKTAFILASSTNPREYIQRRGRVLRKFEGKQYSYIYDFVTLPDSLEKTGDYDKSYLKNFQSLVKNEVNRITEFAKLAENSSDSDKLINEINKAYGLLNFEKVEDFEQIDWEYIDYGE